MPSDSFSEAQTTKIEDLLRSLGSECALDAAAVCDTGGNIVASYYAAGAQSFENAAALAAGSFAATRELARIIGESGFNSIMHKGREKSLLIQSVGGDFIAVIFLGKSTVEGMVRLILKKISPQIFSVLEAEKDAPAAIPQDVEIKKASD